MNTGYREFDDFSSMAGKWNSVRGSFGGEGGGGGTKEEFAPPWNLYIGMQAHQLRLLYPEDFSVLNFCSQP